jgi:hypothetical protein
MISKKRQQLIDDLRTAAATGDRWKLVAGHGLTVRYTETLPTPQHMRTWPSQHNSNLHPYDTETYDRHVFLTLAHVQAKPLLRIARAPWVGATDTEISLARALEVLADPGSVL